MAALQPADPDNRQNRSLNEALGGKTSASMAVLRHAPRRHGGIIGEARLGSGAGILTFPMMNALQLRTVAVLELST